MQRAKEKRTVISVPEVKEILKTLDPETLDQIQKRTFDYTEKFSKLSEEKAKAIRAELVKECGLTEEEAVEIVNIVPRTLEELRVFTSGWKKLIPTETLEAVLKILGEGRD